jgi:hypothetical protein
VTDASQKKDNKLSGGAIAGIVLGSIALLSLAVAAAYILASKRTKQITYAQVASEVKDRFWAEHGVRLAEDGPTPAEPGAVAEPAAVAGPSSASADV